MMLVYGFVYYFLLAMVGLSFSLIIFAFRPIRRALHWIETKSFSLFHNVVIKYAIYLSFAIIGLILLDSVTNFITLSQHFAKSKFALIQIKICLLKVHFTNSI